MAKYRHNVHSRNDMAKGGLDQKLDEPLLKWGRKLIGRALKRVRNQAGLKTDFAPQLMGESMIRMVEAGSAEVPSAKIRSYAAALRHTGRGPMINADAVTLAYTSLRAHTFGQATSQDELGRFNWTKLRERDDETSVENHVYSELTRPASYASQRVQYPTMGSLDALNPIQWALINEIAGRVQKFGTDVLSDEGIAEWEKNTVPRLRSVLAIACSLESELGTKFIDTFLNATREKNFAGYRYLVVHEGPKSELDDVREEIVQKVARDTSENSSLAPKLTINPITESDYKAFLRKIAPPSSDGWDGLYLYLLDGQIPDLLIGSFRRIRAPFRDSEPMNLRSWGGVAMNEALPWRFIGPYREHFEALWKKVCRQSGKKKLT